MTYIDMKIAVGKWHRGVSLDRRSRNKNKNNHSNRGRIII